MTGTPRAGRSAAASARTRCHCRVVMEKPMSPGAAARAFATTSATGSSCRTRWNTTVWPAARSQAAR